MIALLFTLGTAAAVASGCHGTDDPNTGNVITPPTIPPGWTVIVYGVGRNESGNVVNTQLVGGVATSPLTVYEAAISGTNVVLPPFATTNRIHVFTPLGGSTAVVTDDVRGSQNMVDPAEFENFVEFAIRIAPAPHYALILLGHGGFPICGLGSENVAPIATLDLASIDAALGTARANTGLVKFDIIGTDMPDGINLESIAVFQKHGNFAAGFEGCAPGSGFDYAGISAAIKGNYNILPAPLSATVANTILPKVVAGSFSALSSDTVVAPAGVDLTATPALLSAFDAFAASLLADLTALPGTISMIGSARRTVADFDQHVGANIIDAGEFADTISKIVSPTAVTAATKTAATAFVALCPPKVGALDYPNARGIGVYFPHAKKFQAPTYSTAAASLLTACPNWGALLASYYSKLSLGAVTPTVTVAVPGVISVSAPFTVSGTVSPAALCHDVTVVLTTSVGGLDQVVGRISVGAPDPPLPNPVGTFTYTGQMSFTQMFDTTGLVLPIFTPLARNQQQGLAVAPLASYTSGLTYAINCDVQYSVAAATTTTVTGVYKVENVLVGAVAPISTAQFTGWTPIGINGAFGHDDVLSAGGGLNYKIFPHFVYVTATGNIVHSSQGIFGYTRGAGDALKTAAPIPGAYKIWVIAESLNGDIGFVSQAVTLIP
ncbi:hypothetical protein HY251_00635 [bacterium]|nr:hypothetical protein [bacterium]